jgi:hypothetical protein
VQSAFTVMPPTHESSVDDLRVKGFPPRPLVIADT